MTKAWFNQVGGMVFREATAAEAAILGLAPSLQDVLIAKGVIAKSDVNAVSQII